MTREEALQAEDELLRTLDEVKRDIDNRLHTIYVTARQALSINLRTDEPIHENVAEFFLDIMASCSDWRSSSDSEKHEMIVSMCQLFAAPAIKEHRKV